LPAHDEEGISPRRASRKELADVQISVRLPSLFSKKALIRKA
jgi:hypothetical protein